jgi:hypothetical protein
MSASASLTVAEVPDWLRDALASPQTREWMRVRLELALFDAREQRLGGLVGQYSALRRLDGTTLPAEVCAGYREIGALLQRAGQPTMSECATRIAHMLERWFTRDASEGAMHRAPARSG